MKRIREKGKVKVWNSIYYNKNKSKIIKKNNSRRQQMKDFIKEQKSGPCSDCGVKYPYYVMDFDHKNEKEFNVSNGPALGVSMEKLLEEISKCDIVCSNCHRERTHNRIYNSVAE